MFRGNGFDGFQFDEYLALDKDIGVEVANALAPEFHFDGLLRHGGQALLA